MPRKSKPGRKATPASTTGGGQVIPGNLAKMQLSESDVQTTLKACAGAVGEFIEDAPPRANVRGLGVGCKWTEGCPTGEPALVILVNQKVGKEQLSKADMVPATLQGMQTDVLAVGEVFAGNNDVGVQTLAKRLRPAEGGYSVGHFKITAGTIATCVYDVTARRLDLRHTDARSRHPAQGLHPEQQPCAGECERRGDR